MIHLEVIGIPAPQGSKTRMPNGAMVEAGSKTGREKLKSWRQAVTETALAWKNEHPDDAQLTGPLLVDILFQFPPVASNPYRRRHATKPDLDKLVRSVFDPLTHVGLIRDDCQVFRLFAEKRYGVPGGITGASISIGDLGLEEASEVAEAKRRAKAERAAARKSA